MNVFQSPDKDKLKAELFPKSDDKEYQNILRIAKDTAGEHGHLEVHEIFMTTDAVQCRSCTVCVTLGHTHCECGLILFGASQEVKKQVLKNVINCFHILTTGAFAFETETGCSADSQLYQSACNEEKTI